MRLIRRPEVLRRCGISKSAMYRCIQAGDFPEPVKIGIRAVAWVEEEIDQWISTRVKARGEE